jgi:hypothetical protein
MKPSLALSALCIGFVIAGLQWLSLPAWAECWMTCPPGPADSSVPYNRGVIGAAIEAPSASAIDATKLKPASPTGAGAAVSAPIPAGGKAGTEPPTISPDQTPMAPLGREKAVSSAKPKNRQIPAVSKAAPAPLHVQDKADLVTETPMEPATPVRTPVGQAKTSTIVAHQASGALRSSPNPDELPSPIAVPGLVPGTPAFYLIPE